MTNELNFQGSTSNPSFEIELCVRNPEGQPTGRTKSLSTDDPHKLWEFWNRHRGRPRRKKKKEQVPTAKEADKIMSEMKDYVPKKQRKNNEG